MIVRFWGWVCRLGSTDRVPSFGGKEGGDEKVQAIELPVSELGLFLFLHLHPDATAHRYANILTAIRIRFRRQDLLLSPVSVTVDSIFLPSPRSFPFVRILLLLPGPVIVAMIFYHCHALLPLL